MNRKPEAAFAVIDFGRTSSVCMDIHCPCGAHVHLDTWGEDGSAEHVRCPWCKDVLRIGADINLLDQREDFSVEQDAYVFIQWKGSDVVMGATCTCKQSFEIVGDFTYECDCPHCGKHYHCESQLMVTKLSAEEAAQVSKIQEPEKHPDEMDDEERAAYDAKLEVQHREQEATRRSLLAGIEVCCLVDPNLSYAHYSNAVPGDGEAKEGTHVFEIPIVGAPGPVVIGAALERELLRHDSGRVVLVTCGDILDGAGRLDGRLPDGVKIVVLPDLHVPSASEREAHEEMFRALSDSIAGLNADFGSRRRGGQMKFPHGVVEQKKGRYKQGKPGNPFAGDNAHIRNVQRNDLGPRRGGNRGGGRGK